MNYFDLHIGDYQRKTAHLSLAEHGAYSLMLQNFYATERPLPADRKVLYRLLRAESAAERKAIDSVATQFWREDTGGLINQRASETLASYREWVERQRAAGRASGVKRSLNQRSTGDEPGHQPTSNHEGNRNATKNEPLTSHSDTHLDTHSHSESKAAPNGSRERVGDFAKAGSGWKPPTEEEIRAGK